MNYLLTFLFLLPATLLFSQKHGKTAAKKEVEASASVGVIALPEFNLLYRGYNNMVQFAVPGNADSVWIEGKGVLVIMSENGRGIAKITGTGREVSMTLKSCSGKDTLGHGTYLFRVANLPRPDIYWGPHPLEGAEQRSDSMLFCSNAFFAKYPPEIPLKAAFEVTSVEYLIDGKVYAHTGKLVTEEVRSAIEAAEQGSEISITRIQVEGPGGRMQYLDLLKRIKTSPKGTPFQPEVIRWAED